MSRIGTSSYQVGTAGGACAATGRPLTAGDRVVSVLLEPAGRDDLVRQDYSVEAWERGMRPDASAGRVLAHWRSIVGEHRVRGPALLDDDALLDLFEQLEEQTEEKRVALRFVLGLILVRKRLLAYEGGSRGADGRSVMLVRHKGVPKLPEGPPSLVVVDPGLTEDEIAAVSDQLESVMAGGAPEGARG